MLQLQIFHLTKYPKATDPQSSYLLDEYELNFGPLMDVMKENKDKSELRVFINLCREFAPLKNYSPNEYSLSECSSICVVK